MDSENKATGGESAIMVGEAIAGVVHDFSNIIQAILLRADYVLSNGNLSEPDSRKLEMVLDDSKRIGEILHTLLDKGREEIAATAIDVNLSRIIAGSARPMVEVALPEIPVVAKGDETLLGDLVSLTLEALLNNAPAETSVLIAAETVGHEEVEAMAPPWISSRPWARLSFTRRGEGAPFAPDSEIHLFSRGDAPELDFDLMRIRGLIKLHSGFFRVERDEGAKTLLFRVFLPT